MYEGMVKESAKALDERYPDWADKVDLDLLEMANSARCVTSQMGLTVNDRRELPNVVLVTTLWREHEDTGEILYPGDVTDSWRAEIRARQTA